MPRISSFYGIVIAMFHDETRHIGRPHVHAAYAEANATLDIETLEVLAGELPPRVLRLIREWAAIHEGELRRNWERARRHEPLLSIAPLRRS